jgi:hypothetical protein
MQTLTARMGRVYSSTGCGHGVFPKRGRVDLWLKDIAPSTELRKWFSHDASKWTEFRGDLCVGCGELGVNRGEFQMLVVFFRAVVAARECKHQGIVPLAVR